MNRLLAALGLLAALAAPAAAEECFQLSADARSWSKRPETLCISENGAGKHLLRLRTGFGQDEVGWLRFDLVKRVKCFDCNRDEFALASPSYSIFNRLKIVFNGRRNAQTTEEKGTVLIGRNRFFYRRVNQPEPEPRIVFEPPTMNIPGGNHRTLPVPARPDAGIAPP